MLKLLLMMLVCVSLHAEPTVITLCYETTYIKTCEVMHDQDLDPIFCKYCGDPATVVYRFEDGVIVNSCEKHFVNIVSKYLE